MDNLGFQYDVPIIEIRDDKISITAEDAALSLGLRVFEKYEPEVRDAVWALFSRPDPNLVGDVFSLMSSDIMMKVKDSRIRPCADLDLVTRPNYVVVPEKLSAYPSRLKDVILSMTDLNFVSQSLDYVMEGCEKGMVTTIVNSSWLDIEYVRSLLFAMIHSQTLILNDGDHELAASIGSVPVTRSDHSILDFLLLNFDGCFDPMFLVRPCLKKEVTDIQVIRSFEQFMNQLAPIESRCDIYGVKGNKVLYYELRKFLDEASDNLKGFYPLAFFFLYRDKVANLYEMVSSQLSEDEYDQKGATMMEIYSSVIDKSMVADDTLVSYDLNGVMIKVKSNSALNTLLGDDSYNRFKESISNKEINKFFSFFPFYRGMRRIKSAHSYEDTFLSKKYKNEGRALLVGKALVEWADGFSSATCLSEWSRLYRLTGSSQLDQRTNECSSLFPGHYASIFDSVLSRDLPKCEGFISNSNALTKHANAGGLFHNGLYQEFSNLKSLAARTDAYGNMLVPYAKRLILLDLVNSESIFHSDDNYSLDKFLEESGLTERQYLFRFHKTWSSNYLFWDKFDDQNDFYNLVQNSDFMAMIVKFPMPSNMKAIEFFLYIVFFGQ